MPNVKISALPAIASVAAEDLVAVVDDPSGTPATRKATVTQLGAAIVAAAIPTLVDPPRVHVRRTSNATVTTTLAVAWQAATSNPHSMWSSGSQITTTTAGRYTVTANIGWASAGDTTARSITIRKNGSGSEGLVQFNAINGADTYQEVTTDVVLNGTTDYFEVVAAESSAGTVTINYAHVRARWVAPS